LATTLTGPINWTFTGDQSKGLGGGVTWDVNGNVKGVTILSTYTGTFVCRNLTVTRSLSTANNFVGQALGLNASVSFYGIVATNWNTPSGSGWYSSNSIFLNTHQLACLWSYFDMSNQTNGSVFTLSGITTGVDAFYFVGDFCKKAGSSWLNISSTSANEILQEYNCGSSAEGSKTTLAFRADIRNTYFSNSNAGGSVSVTGNGSYGDLSYCTLSVGSPTTYTGAGMNFGFSSSINYVSIPPVNTDIPGQMQLSPGSPSCFGATVIAGVNDGNDILGFPFDSKPSIGPLQYTCPQGRAYTGK
jgi:hypothetical protein